MANEMNKKQRDDEQGPDSESAASNAASRARSSVGNKRKSASHSSANRKRSKSASRNGNTTGGIHQRGDKKVLR